MATFTVKTTEEEQATVLQVLKAVEGQTIPVSTIAEMACMGPSRVRYAITDLIDAGKVERVPSKAFNKHYIRYAYKVL